MEFNNLPVKETIRFIIPGIGLVSAEKAALALADWIWTDETKAALKEAVLLGLDKEPLLAACQIFSAYQGKDPKGFPDFQKDPDKIKAIISGIDKALQNVYRNGAWRLSAWAKQRHENDFEKLLEIQAHLKKTLNSLKPRRSGRPQKDEETQVRLTPDNEWEFYLEAKFYSKNAILYFAQAFREATEEPHDKLAYKFFCQIYGPLQGNNAEEEYKRRRAKLEKQFYASVPAATLGVKPRRKK